MSQEDVPARAANIHRSVASTIICNTATVESLRSYLLTAVDIVHRLKKGAEHSVPSKKNTHCAAQAKGRGSSAIKRLAVNVLEVAGEGGHIQLQPRKRFELATEVVNISLKALTEAIKTPPFQRKRTSLAGSSSNLSPNGETKSLSRTPMQPVCVNRTTQSPGKRSHSRRSSSTASLNQRLDGLKAQAECARIAFAALRSLQGCQGCPNLPVLQLETGMSALIGKLIALGFDELAFRELRILRRRLESFRDTSKSYVESTMERILYDDDGSNAKSETLACMLKYRNIGAKGPVLALIITSQLQALRILALIKDPSATESALKHLQLEVPYSPANLIQQHTLPAMPGSQDKRALQLESLDKLLMALCPSTSKSEDERNSKVGKALSPEVSLQLQCLVFRIRLIWWRLSGHQSNMVTELIDPFCRCLSAFQRRARRSRSVKYDIAKITYQMVANALEDEAGFHEGMFFVVHQTLAELAQDCLQEDEAIAWFQECGKSAVASRASPAEISTVACRLATLQLRIQDSCSTDGPSNILQDVTHSLRGNLQGGSVELDNLLIAVASLRKSAFQSFQKGHRPSSTNDTRVLSTFADECRDIVLLCVSFMVRYLGDGFAPGDNDRVLARREQRRTAVARFVGPTVQSVITIARLSAESDAEIWQRVESGLQDCFKLAIGVKTEIPNTNQESSEDKPNVHPFVSISNAYWIRYQHLERASADTKSLRKCLQMCIDVIKNRPLCERVAGHLSRKLEKRGRLFENMRQYKKAAEAYDEAISAQLRPSLLPTLRDAAATRSLQETLEDDVELETLSKFLLAYSRVSLKAAKEGEQLKTIYDPEELATDERGMILELQLQAIYSYDQDLTSIIRHHTDVLANTLLSLYSPNLFPVRRMRVVIRLLVFRLTRPNALDSNLQIQLLGDFIDDSSFAHSDAGLLRYLPYLTACRQVLVGLCHEIPDAEGIRTVISSWSSLVQDHQDWKSLKAQVDDITGWIMQLELLADYLEMQGLGLLKVLVLNISATIDEGATTIQNSVFASRLSELGIQWARLGYSGTAGLILHKAQRYIEASNASYEVVARWHLAYAEYALENVNLASCKEHLARARECFNNCSSFSETQNKRPREMSGKFQLVADTYYVRSCLAAAEGLPSHATYLARLSIRTIQRAWAYLERCQSKDDRTLQNGPAKSEGDGSVEALPKSTFFERPPVQKSMISTDSGVYPAAFWKLLARLFRGFTQISLLYATHGLIPEVQYYLEQSQKVAMTARAPYLLGQYFMQLGQESIRSGAIIEATSLLEQADDKLSSVQPDHNYATLQLIWAVHHSKKNNLQASESAFVTAEKTIRSLTARSFVDSLNRKRTTEEDLDQALSALTLQDAKPIPQTLKSQGRAASKKTTNNKSLAKQKAPKIVDEDIPAIEVIGLDRIRGHIIRSRIDCSLRAGNLGVAASMLEEAEKYTYGYQCSVSQAILKAQLYFRQGLERLARDPVLCVIPESTISCPSMDRQWRRSPAQAIRASAEPASSRNSRSRALPKASQPKSSSSPKPEIDLFNLAQETINEIFSLARDISSTATIHEVSDLLGKILITISVPATSSADLSNPVSTSLLVYVLEIGRMLSMYRQISSIQVERQLCQPKETTSWPSETCFEDQFFPRSRVSVDLATFQADCIDIIPSNWTAVSISLSHSLEDIFICKIRSGHAPFVLRLPLSRQSSLDCDEEVFGFQQAKGEMRDIILLANSSAGGVDDIACRGARAEWWNTRQRLDARLKDLLNNIQNIWLGGFRGIFSQMVHKRDLLSRFQQSFQNILGKHLPSRQKTGRGVQGTQVTLDQNVLELFVSLGCPSESNEIDEPLTDLLYFVVDVLQFNGERNAYDEIDFDSVAVETIDALRHYHQALMNEDSDALEQHTILILDKDLHCFPWESLPCLNQQAISRIPSLGCLRDRILQQRSRFGRFGSSQTSSETFRISGLAGASLLNPAGDLTATQERLEPALQELCSWENIVQREPGETEMKSLLEDHELFLYFGHGSGGKYIRPSTIKKLEKCAVSLLMGCSSGALTEAGDFEPYGMPIYYMDAGCPALVANLWDVTDKDIDRFSQTVLEQWGLFRKAQPPRSPVKKSARQVGRNKAEKVGIGQAHDQCPLSLDQAVSRGRDFCKLRYLNGAAPVIYGVPVYLS